MIVFNNGPGPLHRVSSSGGQSSPVLKLAEAQTSHNFPSFLPDGHHVLFYALETYAGNSGLYVGSLDSAESKRLVDSDTGGIFDPSSKHLLFVRQGTLLAQTFDSNTLTPTGEPFPVAEHVESTTVPGIVAFSISTNGVLAYGGSSALSGELELTWVDRLGKRIETVGSRANYRGRGYLDNGVGAGHHVAIHLRGVAGQLVPRLVA